MIATLPITADRPCHVRHYINAWTLGTGLQVSLKPGEYRITGAGSIDGVAFLQLDGACRCAADACELEECATNATADSMTRLLSQSR